jgi:hypothetical protein
MLPIYDYLMVYSNPTIDSPRNQPVFRRDKKEKPKIYMGAEIDRTLDLGDPDPPIDINRTYLPLVLTLFYRV